MSRFHFGCRLTRGFSPNCADREKNGQKTTLCGPLTGGRFQSRRRDDVCGRLKWSSSTGRQVSRTSLARLVFSVRSSHRIGPPRTPPPSARAIADRCLAPRRASLSQVLAVCARVFFSRTARITPLRFQKRNSAHFIVRFDDTVRTLGRDSLSRGEEIEFVIWRRGKKKKKLRKRVELSCPWRRISFIDVPLEAHSSRAGRSPVCVL